MRELLLSKPQIEALTPAERRILKLIGEDYTSKEIADLPQVERPHRGQSPPAHLQQTKTARDAQPVEVCLRQQRLSVTHSIGIATHLRPGTRGGNLTRCPLVLDSASRMRLPVLCALPALTDYVGAEITVDILSLNQMKPNQTPCQANRRKTAMGIETLQVMKTRLTILKFLIILCSIFATTAVFGQTTYHLDQLCRWRHRHRGQLGPQWSTQRVYDRHRPMGRQDHRPSNGNRQHHQLAWHRFWHVGNRSDVHGESGQFGDLYLHGFRVPRSGPLWRQQYHHRQWRWSGDHRKSWWSWPRQYLFV